MSQTLYPDIHLEVKPTADEQFMGINTTCLIFQSYHGGLSLMYASGSMLFFWLMGLPWFLFILIEPWLPPYGYNEDGSVATFLGSLGNLSLGGFLAYLLFVLIMGGMSLMLTIGMARLALHNVATKYSPIRFNRKTQMVSSVYMSKVYETSWKDITATTHSKIAISQSYIPRTRIVLTLKNKDGDIIGQIEGNKNAENIIDHQIFDGGESLWEYIRIFMTEGPEVLPVPVVWFKFWDLQPQYSYPFKEAVEHHWPWPIIRHPNVPGSAKFFLILFWPYRVVTFLPFLLVEWLWRKMCLKVLPKGRANPALFLKDCDEVLMTGAMVKKVGKHKYDEMWELPYLEAKKRLEAQGLL
ncbi:MAG TPA: hypothetical protein EYG71_02425 [Leucothrix sp.]|nr:hypothetical protein [Leucothrix sp.]